VALFGFLKQHRREFITPLSSSGVEPSALLLIEPVLVIGWDFKQLAII